MTRPKYSTLLQYKREPSWTSTGPLTIRAEEDADGQIRVSGTQRAGAFGLDASGRPKRDRRSRILRPNESKDLRAFLAAMSLTAFPTFPSGCDGYTCEVQMGTYFGGVKYRWWTDPPAGWEPLQDLANMLTGFLSFDKTPSGSM